MTIKILVDMNLSPDWVAALEQLGWSAVHWSTVGDPRATDTALMDWAVKNGHVVFTHDLDFGMVLALTHGTGPSVIQVRAHDALPEQLQKLVATAIHEYEADLASGALVVIDAAGSRARILPL
jgi:predicted nuclease of predicted toxin-antitoxin system